MNTNIKEQIELYGTIQTSDRMLLSLLLSSEQVATRLLEKYKSLHKIAITPSIEMKKVKGMTALRLCRLKCLIELVKRFTAVIKQGAILQGSSQVFYNYKSRFLEEKREHFITLLLDSKHRVIEEYLVSIGTLNASLVHPREVFKEAIRMSAESIICIHNHPSGYIVPSQEDKQVTKRLVEVGKLVGIEVLDHIIIGHTNYCSMAEEKMI